MRTSRKITLVIVASLALSGIQIAQAKPKAKANDLANYSIVHAIPTGYGADIVDVYANNSLVIDNAAPGSIKSFTIPRGSLTISIYANGVVPGPTTTPLLSAAPVYLANGNNFSFVAHLTADEKPKLSLFKNMLTEAGSKRSWLEIRHVAAAPALQIRLNGAPKFIQFVNGMERKRSLTFGNYNLDALYSDTSTVAINPISVNLQKSTNVVLYIWGAKTKGNLTFLKQEIPARK